MCGDERGTTLVHRRVSCYVADAYSHMQRMDLSDVGEPVIDNALVDARWKIEGLRGVYEHSTHLPSLAKSR